MGRQLVQGPKSAAKRALRLALLLFFPLGLAMLGSGANSASAASPHLSNASSVTPKCEPIDLGIHFVGSGVGGPMDISEFQFVNVSRHTCHLEGYPGVVAENAAGRKFDLKVARENFDAKRVQVVQIPPRGRTSFKVESVVPGFQKGRCVTSYYMRFTPPNDYTTLSIRHKLLFCAGGILIGPVERSG